MSMFNKVTKSFQWGEHTVRMETGEIAIFYARDAVPMGGGSSIAAHIDHVRYGLSLMNRWSHGELDPWSSADWTASWNRSVVSDDASKFLPFLPPAVASALTRDDARVIDLLNALQS